MPVSSRVVGGRSESEHHGEISWFGYPGRVLFENVQLFQPPHKQVRGPPTRPVRRK